MKTSFFLTLIFLFPAMAAASPHLSNVPRLECKENNPPGDDPYKGMKDANRIGLRDSYPLLERHKVSTNPRTNTVNDLNEFIAGICKRRKAFEESAKKFQDISKSPDLKLGCEVFEHLNPTYRELEGKGHDLVNYIRTQGEQFSKVFDRNAKAEAQEIIRKQKKTELNQSFKLVWGLDLATTQNATKTRIDPDPNAFFPRRSYQIRKEKEYADSTFFNLSAIRVQMAKNAGGCGILDKDSARTLGTASTTAPAAASTKARTCDTTGFDGREKCEADPMGSGVGGNGPAAGPPGTPAPDAPGGKSWASENKGTILAVGAGAAAVGGLLLYKKHNDDKAKKNARGLDAAAAAQVTAQNGSNSSGGDGSGASGEPARTPNDQRKGKAVKMTGAPSEARVGAALAPILVYLVDENGAPVSDTGVVVTMACTNACSLTGVLSKTTVSGQVEFTGLRFTAPETGIQLRVGAEGTNSITNAVSFDVFETNRQ